MVPQATDERIPETRYPERRGVSNRTVIEEAKRLVTVPELLAEKLSGGPGVGRGRELAFVCPLHDDHDPSLRVDPERGVWYCDPCAEGGDVVRLAQLAGDYPDDGPGAATAAAYLLMEFGYDVPQRSQVWFRKQERQRTVRDRIDAERVEHVRMLVFRLIWMPWLRQLPEGVREEASESAWASSRQIALRLYEQRRGA